MDGEGNCIYLTNIQRVRGPSSDSAKQTTPSHQSMSHFMEIPVDRKSLGDPAVGRATSVLRIHRRCRLPRGRRYRIPACNIGRCRFYKATSESRERETTTVHPDLSFRGTRCIILWTQVCIHDIPERPTLPVAIPGRGLRYREVR